MRKVASLRAAFAVLTFLLSFVLPLHAAEPPKAVAQEDVQPDLPKHDIPRTAEPPSAFEIYASENGYLISQFGYSLFKEAPSTFAPVDNIPVEPGFILGPGDELRISLWGKVNEEISVRIDREGRVSIPVVGSLRIAGLTFQETRAFLEKEFSRFYIPSEVKMNISMGALRSIRVFVVGNAVSPGSYMISSLSTLVNALFSAGGPSKVGTLRDIQVKRAGQTIAHLDLYDFLQRGEKTGDIRLMSEDVIFIPPAGPLAGIAGDVKVPAIYELKGGETLRDLIKMAGEYNDIAYRGRLKVERVEGNSRAEVFEANTDDVDKNAMAVRPGDLVRVFPIVSDKEVVRLSGAVQRPGEYGIGKGFTVKDLIELSGGLRYYAFIENAEITRVTVTQRGPETENILINLKKALEGDSANNISLRKNDHLQVRSVPEWDLYRMVTVSGEVRFPGTYTVKKGERISSLIERAGGYTAKAFLKGATFTSENVKALQQKQLEDSIDRLEKEMLSGTVVSAETSSSSEEAAIQQAAISQKRAFLAKLKAVRAKGRVVIKLQEPEKFKGSPSDIELEEGDALSVPSIPSHVQVIGSVYNQNAYVYNPKYTVSNYLKSAGGLGKNSDEDEIYVLKVDGRAIGNNSMGSSWGLISWDSEEGRWSGAGFMSQRLDPGDTIVVPEKIEKIAWLREVKDMTQILYQIAVTAGVLLVAF